MTKIDTKSAESALDAPGAIPFFMKTGLHWFRNDLRLRDNTALLALQKEVDQWLPVFVVDPRLFRGPRGSRPRERFLVDCLARLAAELDGRGLPLLIRHGRPEREIPQLAEELGAGFVSFNEDTSPFALRRDDAVRETLESHGVALIERHDRTIFATDEIEKKTGGFYSVYTPYRNAWWERWKQEPRKPVLGRHLMPAIPGHAADPLPETVDDGTTSLPTGGERAALRRLDQFIESALQRYAVDRDIPAIDGTARLSPYLRFGVISVREAFTRVEEAAEAEKSLRVGAAKWLDELVWREFYAAILEANPRVTHENFRPEYDAVEWNDDPEGFAAWCEGRTGFPIVDAGMRQLRETGWMHNRVRMIVASFLTKDLLIDWRQGERFFFDALVDGDPASNVGGWQWAASTGTDAQPYFRIFNPFTQAERWDPECEYIRRFVPELRDVPEKSIFEPDLMTTAGGYPVPIVDHAERRVMAIERFKAAKDAAAEAREGSETVRREQRSKRRSR